MELHPLPRRSLLRGSAALMAIAGASRRALAASPDSLRDTPRDLPGLAEYAAAWGLPLVLTGRYFALSQQHGIATNRFYLNDALATPADKVPGPNIDTIYGFAWIDLANGPVVLDVPAVGTRYYSIQLVDAYENVFTYVGLRQTGGGAGTYVIAPPGWSGDLPAGAKRIDAPTSLVFALTRTLVRGNADIDAARAVQDAYTLAPLAGYPGGKLQGIVRANVTNLLPKLDLAGNGAAYFAELDALVRRYPPTGEDAKIFAKLAPLGLGQGFAQQKPLTDAQLQTAFDSTLAKVNAYDASSLNDGWKVNYHITNFIADPVQRAANDRLGPGAHIAAEALYFGTKTDAHGAPLSGEHSYSITFPAHKLPPVKGFWSLILYDKNYFLVPNSINRYGINDRTAGLSYGKDGSLKILIQRDAPADTANWLAAPADGFSLILRTYWPDPSVLAGHYKLPKVIKEG